MRAFWAKVTGTPLLWQIAALLVVTQFTAHAATFGLVRSALDLSGTGPDVLAAESVDPFTTVLRVATMLGGDRGAEAIAAAVESDPRFRISARPPVPDDERTSFEDRFQDAVRESVPAAWRSRVIAYEVPSPPFLLLPGRSPGAAVRLPDGNWLIFEQGPQTIWRLLPPAALVLSVLILAIPLTFLAVWSSWVLVSPITALAMGTERFSRDLNAPAIDIRGAREIRTAAAAFNTMRVKIRRLVEDRSRTLAAMSHDMRTPLTRLTLRVESIDEQQVREPIMDDIGLIQRMIDSALTFLRTERTPLSLAKADLAVMVQTVVAHLSDQGMDASYEGPDRLVITCDRDLIRRAVENLTNNALAHAGSLVARLRDPADGWAIVEVLDDGPGIREADRDLVLEPFRKTESSRSVASGGSSTGFGLGLAITRAIVEAHGGTLTLLDNQPRGLVVSIRLPIHPARADLPPA